MLVKYVCVLVFISSFLALANISLSHVYFHILYRPKHYNYTQHDQMITYNMFQMGSTQHRPLSSLFRALCVYCKCTTVEPIVLGL